MKVTCDVVKDLILLKETDMVSGDSNEIIKEHIQNCEHCRNYSKSITDSQELFNKEALDEEAISNKNTLKKGLKKLKKRWCISSIICTLIIGTILFSVIGTCVWFFYPNKTYEFFGNDLGEYYGVQISFDDENHKDFTSFDAKFIDELMNNIEDIKMRPLMATDVEQIGKGYHINLFTKDGKYLTLWFYETIDGYAVTIFNEINGAYDEPFGYLDSALPDWLDGIYAGIELEDGDELYRYLKEYKNDSIKNISSEDILALSNMDEKSWFDFAKYNYEDDTEYKKIEVDWEGFEPARFEIDGINGYMIVWHSNSIYEKDNERYHKYNVYDAKVYDEAGNEMSIYDENIKTYLEGLQ